MQQSKRVLWDLHHVVGSTVGHRQLLSGACHPSGPSFGNEAYNGLHCAFQLLHSGVHVQGTRVEGMVNKLFEGHTINYIECINVDYKSTRREPFMDVQVGGACAVWCVSAHDACSWLLSPMRGPKLQGHLVRWLICMLHSHCGTAAGCQKLQGHLCII